MNDFTEYLQERNYSNATVTRYTKGIQPFLEWLEDEGLQTDTFGYNDLLDFLRHRGKQAATPKNTNSLLCMVRHYCSYLILENKRTDNPAAGVFVKGVRRNLPSNLLGTEELESLYVRYCALSNTDGTRRAMLGLMVFQALTLGELQRLQPQHLRLDEGKVYVKGTTRTNARTLELKAVQTTTLSRCQLPFPGSVANRVQYLFSRLRRIDPRATNAKQVRSSVITEWLRKGNLRQVQYMAGHKYASSTQRYSLAQLEDLQRELGQRHPMAAEVHHTAERTAGNGTI